MPLKAVQPGASEHSLTPPVARTRLSEPKPCVVQDLVARGLVSPGQGLSLARGADDHEAIYRDVTINDAAPNLRHHLTKRSTQDDISKRTKAAIVVRGRYMPPGTQEGEEKPLYLKCTPGISRQEVRP